MLRGIDPNGDFLLAALHQIDSRSQRSTEQITSGLKVNRPSDSPTDVVDILQLHARIDFSVQTQTNLNSVKTDVAAADASLQSATKIIDRLIAIASEGASDTAGTKRPTLADETTQLLGQLVGISATTVNGRYIFSGDQDQKAAYAVDLQAANGVQQLTTAGATGQVDDGQENKFVPGLTAQQIFDSRNPDNSPADGNLFVAVNRLRLALTSNDRAQIEAALTALHSAADHVNQSLAFYGNTSNHVDLALQMAQKIEGAGRAALSGKQDTDLPAAISDLNLQNTSRSAALGARGQQPKGTLFDYLG